MRLSILRLWRSGPAPCSRFTSKHVSRCMLDSPPCTVLDSCWCMLHSLPRGQNHTVSNRTRRQCVHCHDSSVSRLRTSLVAWCTAHTSRLNLRLVGNMVGGSRLGRCCPRLESSRPAPCPNQCAHTLQIFDHFEFWPFFGPPCFLDCFHPISEFWPFCGPSLAFDLPQCQEPWRWGSILRIEPGLNEEQKKTIGSSTDTRTENPR